MHATDSDSGENARVTYKLASDSSAEIQKLFALDPISGNINLNGNLDNEVRKYYNFFVHCVDHGIPSKSAIAKVEINILDVNDNPPIFSESVVKKNIKEDTRIGTIITRVQARDADEGQNGEILYSLSRVDPNEKGYFIIDKYDGTIRLGRGLDREKIACFELEIEATDKGTPSMSAKAMVSVTIEDINDNAPFFSESRKTYYVLENQDVGSIIGPIQADDLDIGDNANLEYFLIPDIETSRMFYLDSATGELELREVYYFSKKYFFPSFPIIISRGLKKFFIKK